MNISAILRLIGCLFMLALANGCATKNSFPSLALQPREQLPVDEPAPATEIIAADPQLTTRIEELALKVQQQQKEFETAFPTVFSNAQMAGEAGSEGWIEAQQAISRLEAMRNIIVSALAELDALNLSRAAQPTNADQLALLAQTIASVEALNEDQQNKIKQIRALLSEF